MNNERGNILFLILIAVALFAALSYAVTESDQTGGWDINEERAGVLTSEVMVYASSLEKTVQRMLNKGISENDLCFDIDAYTAGNTDYEHAACATSSNRIFDSAGGGLKWQPATAEVMTSAGDGMWIIDGSNRIEDVGTDVVADASSAELTVFLLNINERLCRHINERLGVTASYDAVQPRDDVTMTTTPFVGTYAAASVLADTPALLDGKTSGCFEGGGTPANGTYHFYHVLNVR